MTLRPRPNSWSASSVFLFILIVLGFAGLGLHFYFPVHYELPMPLPVRLDESREAVKPWSISEFEPVWNKQLLFPPPPKTPPVVEPKPLPTVAAIVEEPVPVKLKSILFSDNVRIAVFETIRSSPIQIIRLRTNESFEEIKVIQVAEDSVEIEFKGKAISMRLGK